MTRKIQMILKLTRLSVYEVVFLLGLLSIPVLIKYSINPDTQSGLRLETPNSVLYVEVADDQQEREVGLSNRDFLEKNSGMLFVFERDQAACFWMKDTRIPLDMVWLDDAKKVVYVYENATPESLTPICPNVSSTYVLEVGAGGANKHALELGAKLGF